MFKQIILSVLFVLVSYLSFAQPSQYTPMTAAGYQFKRILTDSTLHIPSFCGTPNLRNSTAKNGALAIDTCNNKLYTWTHGAGWTDISSGGIDTTSLSNRINLKLNISDTATMLSKYLRKTDTTAMLSKYLRKTDTTAMLNPYLRKVDTAAMLTNYAKTADLLFKLNISDTATMLSKYLRKSDTTNKWVQSVTKLNDSTIVVTKNGTATNIVLPRGAAASTPTLQDVTTAGATTGDKITLDWGNYGVFITELNKTYTNGLTNIYPFYLTNTLNSNVAYIQHPEAATGGSEFYYEYFNGSQVSDHVKLNETMLEMSAYGSGRSVQILPTYIDSDKHYLPISNGITDTLATLADVRNGGGSAIDTTGAFLISVSQPNDSTLTFQKGATATRYTIRSSVVASATRLITSVYNKSGATITKGSVVYINGAHSSNLPTIEKAKANAEETSAYTYGLVETDIPNNSGGVVIQSGTITNLNLPTSTYTDGQTLYLSPTTAGGYTLTKPLAPYHYVAIGTITRAHPTQGTIQIAIRNGFQLDEMSDVQIPVVPNDSTLLQFSRVDSLWHSVGITNAIGSNYIKPSDTATMLSKYQRINTAMKYSDTANMLTNYAKTSAVNLKLNISDTTTMLSKYARKDTACLYLIADANTSNLTATNTNLTYAVGANETYRIMIAGTCSKATTPTGMKIAIGAPTGATLKSVIQGGQALVATAPQGQILSSINTLCANPFATGVGVEVPFRLEGVITTGANAGSITLQFASFTSNTATIYAGTVMQLIKAKGL
jgi:hypothetical protein